MYRISVATCGDDSPLPVLTDDSPAGAPVLNTNLVAKEAGEHDVLIFVENPV